MTGFRRGAASVAVLTLMLAASLATPTAAWARGNVVSSSPTDGTALASAPTDVDLTFSEAPDPDLSHVSARDASGREVGSGTLRGAGRDGLRQPVSIEAVGVYTVAYHVQFTDGTDMIGVLRFSVGTGVPPPVADAAAQRAAEAAVLAHVHGVDPVSASLLLLDAVVLLGVIIALLRRPAPRRLLDSLDGDDSG